MPRRRQTLQQIARIEDEKVAQGREAEGVVRVPGTVSKDLQHIVQLNFTPGEMALIEKRASAKGLPVGEYMRNTLLGASSKEKRD